jgi:hypothetical protein
MALTLFVSRNAHDRHIYNVHGRKLKRKYIYKKGKAIPVTGLGGRRVVRRRGCHNL